MDDVETSVLIGTAGLQLALAASVVLAFRAPAKNAARRLRAPGIVLLAIQLAHFIEEWRGGFADRFPATLGLAPWPWLFYPAFNIAWLFLWAAVLVAGGAGYFARAALWFLALSALINAVAHPVLALLTGGYYPGLYTAPLLGLGGLWLASALAPRRRSV